MNPVGVRGFIRHSSTPRVHITPFTFGHGSSTKLNTNKSSAINTQSMSRGTDSCTALVGPQVAALLSSVSFSDCLTFISTKICILYNTACRIYHIHVIVSRSFFCCTLLHTRAEFLMWDDGLLLSPRFYSPIIKWVAAACGDPLREGRGQFNYCSPVKPLN